MAGYVVFAIELRRQRRVAMQSSSTHRGLSCRMRVQDVTYKST